MPEDQEDETRRLLADVDRVVEQSQSLQSDITKRMREQRAEDQPVTQPLGRRSRQGRRRG
jgi:hypothetical protein